MAWDAEAVTKRAASAALVAYVLGVLTTASYLLQQDLPLPDLSALRPRFVYTGALVMTALGVTTLLSVLAWHVGDPVPERSAKKEKAAALAGGADGSVALTDDDEGRQAAVGNAPGRDYFRVAGFAVSMLFFELIAYVLLLARPSPGYVEGDTAVRAVALALAAKAVGLLCLAVVVVSRSTDDRGARLTIGAVAAGAVLWYLSLFSEYLMPVVPDQYGGAQTKRAQFVFTEEGVAAAQALGIPLDGARSGPVALVHEGDDFLALRISTGSALVQIKRDLVVGAVVDGKFPSARDVRTVDRAGVRGVAEPRDQLVLAYTETVDPKTVLDGWDGTATPVALRADRKGIQGSDWAYATVTVWDRTRRRRAELGDIDFPFKEGTTAKGTVWADATMTQNGPDVEITLVEAFPIGRPGDQARLSWNPSAKASDPTGNVVDPREATEQGEDNPDPGPEF